MPDAIASDTATTASQNDDDKPLTMGALKAFLGAELPKVIGSQVNGAITNHTKRLTKDFDDRFAKLTVPKTTGDEGEGGEPTSSAATAGPGQATAPAAGTRQADSEIETLKKLIADQEKRSATQTAALKGELTKEREARTRAERQRVEEAGIAALRAELSGKVIAGTEADVVDLLRARGRIAITDEGRVLVKLGRAEDPEEGLDLKAGVDAFVKSESAKHFVPAPSAQARGGRPTTGSQGARMPANNPSAAFAEKHGMTPEEMLLRG